MSCWSAKNWGCWEARHFSLDGVKLSANVSKEWSGTFDELKHKRDKLQEKLKQVVAEHAQADKQPEVELERQKKRERRLQLQVERLNEFLKASNPSRAAMATRSKATRWITNR